MSHWFSQSHLLKKSFTLKLILLNKSYAINLATDSSLCYKLLICTMFVVFSLMAIHCKEMKITMKKVSLLLPGLA